MKEFRRRTSTRLRQQDALSGDVGGDRAAQGSTASRQRSTGARKSARYFGKGHGVEDGIVSRDLERLEAPRRDSRNSVALTYVGCSAEFHDRLSIRRTTRKGDNSTRGHVTIRGDQFNRLRKLRIGQDRPFVNTQVVRPAACDVFADRILTEARSPLTNICSGRSVAILQKPGA